MGIVTVSSSRSLETDESGTWILGQARKEGHDVVFHRVIQDDADFIRATVRHCIISYRPHAVIISGGTGIAPKDVTIEAIQPLFEKELWAFSTIFAQLSFDQIDSAAILSRATAGIFNKTILFCIPGSLKACKLAVKELILPEIGHMAGHLVENG